MHIEAATSLLQKRFLMSEWVTRQFFDRHPALKQKWGDIGFKRCSEDTAFHFAYLAEAVRFEFPILFTDYLGWTKILLINLRLNQDDLLQNLRLMKEAVAMHLPPEESNLVAGYINKSQEILPSLPNEIPSFIQPDNPFYEITQKWLELLLRHQPREGRRMITEAIRGGASLIDIYQNVLTPALYEVGRLWQTRQINEAEEHYCSLVTQTFLAVLSSEFPSMRIGKSVVGFSVGLEMHEIGIRLVTDCFSNHGWDSVCLGSNVPTRNVDGILRTWAPDVIAISATMTYHLAEVQAAVSAIKNAAIPFKPKILVGGRPFKLCPELGAKLGADVTAHSCGDVLSRTLEAFDRSNQTARLAG